jgi:hypothetical protein
MPDDGVVTPLRIMGSVARRPTQMSLCLVVLHTRLVAFCNASQTFVNIHENGTGEIFNLGLHIPKGDLLWRVFPSL